MENKQRYVYQDIEVELTGRVAKKKLTGSAVRRAATGADLYSVLHEITPTDKEEGSWKKWVDLVKLYEIHEEPTCPETDTTMTNT